MISGYHKIRPYWGKNEIIHEQDHMPQTAPLLDNATTLNVNYAFSSKKKRNEQNSQISSVLPGNVHVY